MQAIRVMVAAPGGEMADRLCEYVRRDPALELAAFCREANRAAQSASETRPHVVALDLRLFDPGAGYAVTVRSMPGARVLAIGPALEALPAFSAGADDFVHLPAVGIDSETAQFVSNVVERLKILALGALLPLPQTPRRCKPVRLIAIAAAQGWPVQLACLLKALPRVCPPVMALLADPQMNERESARLLQRMTGWNVAPGEDGMELRCGQVILTGNSCRIRTDAFDDRFVLHISVAMENSSGAAADLLFRTAARAAGGGLVALSFSGEGVESLDAAAEGGALAVVYTKNALLREAVYKSPGGISEYSLEDIATEIVKRIEAQSAPSAG